MHFNFEFEFLPEPRTNIECAPTSAKSSENPRLVQHIHAPSSPEAQARRTQHNKIFLSHSSQLLSGSQPKNFSVHCTSDLSRRANRSQPHISLNEKVRLRLSLACRELGQSFISASSRSQCTTAAPSPQPCFSPRYFALTLNPRVARWTMLARPAQLGREEQDATSQHPDPAIVLLRSGLRGMTFLSCYLSLDQTQFIAHTCLVSRT